MKTLGTMHSELAGKAARLSSDPSTLSNVKKATRQIRAGQSKDLMGLQRMYEQKQQVVASESVQEEEPVEVLQALH